MRLCTAEAIHAGIIVREPLLRKNKNNRQRCAMSGGQPETFVIVQTQIIAQPQNLVGAHFRLACALFSARTVNT